MQLNRILTSSLIVGAIFGSSVFAEEAKQISRKCIDIQCKLAGPPCQLLYESYNESVKDDIRAKDPRNKGLGQIYIANFVKTAVDPNRGACNCVTSAIDMAIRKNYSLISELIDRGDIPDVSDNSDSLRERMNFSPERNQFSNSKNNNIILVNEVVTASPMVSQASEGSIICGNDNAGWVMVYQTDDRLIPVGVNGGDVQSDEWPSKIKIGSSFIFDGASSVNVYKSPLPCYLSSCPASQEAGNFLVVKRVAVSIGYTKLWQLCVRKLG